jgi:light-regulated signal transduction histidine kinase (bacteriophytochrome)
MSEHAHTPGPAEGEVARLREELQRCRDEFQQFVYVASHDLGAPLRIVTSFAQLLQERYGDKLDADAAEFIGFITDGAHQMQALLQALLDYSRVGTRGKPFAPVDTDLALCQAIANLTQPIREAEAEVTCDTMPTVQGDEAQIVQLFQLLIDNAVKFRREGRSPRIHVAVQPEGDAFRFSVRDNGIGFDPRHADRVLTMFQRLHSREEYPGVGAGLAVARRIVERHGGRIAAESEPGKGTTVSFTLAAARPAAEAERDPASDNALPS